MKNPARQKADTREDSRFGIFGDIVRLMEDNEESERGVFALDIISGISGIVEDNLSKYGFSIEKVEEPEGLESHYGRAVEIAEYKRHHKSQHHK